MAVNGRKQFGLYSPVQYLGVENSADGYNDLNTILSAYAFLDMQDRILGLYPFPKNLFTRESQHFWPAAYAPYNHCGVITNANPKYSVIEVTRPTKFIGDVGTPDYTPKNKKMLTYPFIYCLATTGGKSAEYVFEKGLGGKLKFRVYGTFSTEPRLFVVPENYDHLSLNYMTTISDPYNPLPCVAQSFVSLLGNNGLVNTWLPILASSMVNPAAGASMALTAMGNANTGNYKATGNTGTSLIPYAGTALGPSIDTHPVPSQSNLNVNTSNLPIGEQSHFYSRGKWPDTSGFKEWFNQYAQELPTILGTWKLNHFKYTPGQNDSLVATGIKRVEAITMGIRVDDAIAIDNFFSMYGYSTQKIKVPNRHVRESWTYTKTKGCKLIPTNNGVPSYAVEKIKSIYDSGITFWDKNATIGDYSQSNNTFGQG